MQVKQAVPPGILRVVKRELPQPSPEARRRLRWMIHYQKHNCNVSLTCRYFGISRPAFYRWHRRYNPQDLRSLESRSCRPRRVRRPTWSRELAVKVLGLREEYPCWGKYKLATLLEREGLKVSVSMVGRILKHLKRTGELKEPRRFAVSAGKRRMKRIYATRKPKDYQAKEPGDIVQVDTLDLRLLPGVVRKQFTARDVVSKWDVLDIRGRATARLAAEFVETIVRRMPFKVKAIQVDGGSEYMAEFEEACRAREILLFVLPPRSPKLNGGVERAQRTHTEEYWELTSCDTEVRSMRRGVRQQEHVYNTIRPHQALGYLTPLEFVTNWKQKQALKQVV